MDNVIYFDFKAKKRLVAESIIKADEIPKSLFSDRKTAFLELLQAGMVRTVINSKISGVILPEAYDGQIVNLNWSYKFSIPDLIIDSLGIKGTLSFQQESFHVTIPWLSIMSIWNLNSPSDSRVDWSTNVEQ